MGARKIYIDDDCSSGKFFEIVHSFYFLSSSDFTLGIIKRNFMYVNKSTFILLYKAMVRPHIDYAHSVWNPFLKGNIEKEKVQKRATKLVI